MNKLIKRSLFNALGTVIYVMLIATIIMNGERIFGHTQRFLAPVAFLLTFVVSAAITGSLVLGKPVLMYLDGEKSGAMKLFLYTLGWLIAMTIILLIVSVAIR